MNDTTASSLSDDTRNILGRAPVLVFLLVAAADGQVDKKELKMFQKLIAMKQYEVLLAMLQQTEESLSEAVRRLLADDRNLIEHLITLSHTLNEALPPEPALLIKGTLVAFAKEIAEASGGFLGVFGSRISNEEKAALTVIVQTFGLLEAAASNTKPKAAETLSEIPDNLYPLLKSNQWADKARGSVLVRSVYGDDEIKPEEPVVAYAIDSPETVEFVNADSLDGSLSVQALHEGAIANLEARLSGRGAWNEITVDLSPKGHGVVKGLVYSGDFYCAEAMLSETILKQAHQMLDSAFLMLAAPERGKLFVTHLVDQDQPEAEKLVFMAVSVKHYFNPHEAPIAPTVWIARNGKMVGHVAGMDAVIEAAKQAAQADLEGEEKMLRCEPSRIPDKDSYSVHLNVVAKDIEIMCKNLQHAIRDCATQNSEDEQFSGQIHVSLSIEDPNYNADGQQALTELMNDMFAYLTSQLQSIMDRVGRERQIALTYTILD